MMRIGFVMYPGASIMGLAAVAAFETANMVSKTPPYEVHFISEHGGLVRSSVGIDSTTERLDSHKFDTLVIGGGTVLEMPTPGLVAFMRGSLKRCRRVTSVCNGAFVLAEAGLLDGRRATTHWYYSRELQTRYPAAKVDADRIFTVDGQVWTSAGMTAGIDLALALIEDDLGEDVARDVARKLVVYHRRGGGQSQFSALLEMTPKSDNIQKAIDFARKNLGRSLDVPQLAKVAHLSPRQFSRAFHAETGQSPAKAVENLRVEAARLMMDEGRYSLDEIATETGFGARDRMRRAFLRVVGQPPQAMRRQARA